MRYHPRIRGNTNDRHPLFAAERGYTVLELMVTLLLVAVLTETALYSLRQITDPLNDASTSMEHYLHLARTSAISNTEVIKVRAVSSTRLEAQSSDSCTGTMTTIPQLYLDLPTGSSLSDTTITACFTQRGFADAPAAFPIVDTTGQAKTVRVALGGGTTAD